MVRGHVPKIHIRCTHLMRDQEGHENLVLGIPQYTARCALELSLGYFGEVAELSM